MKLKYLHFYKIYYKCIVSNKIWVYNSIEKQATLENKQNDCLNGIMIKLTSIHENKMKGHKHYLKGALILRDLFTNLMKL